MVRGFDAFENLMKFRQINCFEDVGVSLLNAVIIIGASKKFVWFLLMYTFRRIQKIQIV